jgi:hypothetical protein
MDMDNNFQCPKIIKSRLPNFNKKAKVTEPEITSVANSLINKPSLTLVR